MDEQSESPPKVAAPTREQYAMRRCGEGLASVMMELEVRLRAGDLNRLDRAADPAPTDDGTSGKAMPFSFSWEAERNCAPQARSLPAGVMTEDESSMFSMWKATMEIASAAAYLSKEQIAAAQQHIASSARTLSRAELALSKQELVLRPAVISVPGHESAPPRIG